MGKRWEKVFLGSVHSDGEEKKHEYPGETQFNNKVYHQLNLYWLGFTLVPYYLVHYPAPTDYHESITSR